MWSPFELAYLVMVVLSFVILAVVLYGVERYCRQPSPRVDAAGESADALPLETKGSLGPA
jgi:hypothetical protein